MTKRSACQIVLWIVVLSTLIVSVHSQQIFFPSQFTAAPGVERGFSTSDFFNFRNRRPSPFSSGVSLPLSSRIPSVSSNFGGVTNDAKCKITDGLIYYKGICSRLLAKCDDSSNQWLVVNQHGHPNCLNRPCPLGELLFRGRCVSAMATSVCGISEILYVEFTGIVHCDCEQHLIFDRGLGQCMAEHSQGSCPDGKILELEGRDVICVDSNCPTDNLVYNTNDNNCYTKTYEGACSKAKGLSLTFHSDSNTATCVGSTLRNILEVPALTSCPAGSKRDPLGRCQAVFRTDSPLSLRVPTQHTSRYSVCPPTYTRLPNGVCRKSNTLFAGQ